MVKARPSLAWTTAPIGTSLFKKAFHEIPTTVLCGALTVVATVMAIYRVREMRAAGYGLNQYKSAYTIMRDEDCEPARRPFCN